MNRRGFSLVEVAVSALLVGVVLVAAARTVESARGSEARQLNMARARQLADVLSHEIGACAYADPSGGSAMGIDAGEDSRTRSTFDDVDDYLAAEFRNVRDRNGKLLVDGEWSATVEVEWYNECRESAWPVETGMKRITVSILFRKKPIAQNVLFKSRVP